MIDPTETSADEAVAAELSALLPRLPRVKITPQTISQNIIDRWYGYETEYRQTIAELRAELAAATERAVKAEGDAAGLREVVANLRRLRAEQAEQIGGDRWRVRYQLGPLTEWTEPTRHETSARDWLETFREHYPGQPASLWHGYETQWREVPDA